MTAQLIDRRALKAETRETLAEAQVSPKAFTALYLALVLAMNLVDSFTGIGMLATFVSILITLLALVLEAGFVLYCMAVRRQGNRTEHCKIFLYLSLVPSLHDSRHHCRLPVSLRPV